jgi:O-antigen ligase
MVFAILSKALPHHKKTVPSAIPPTPFRLPFWAIIPPAVYLFVLPFSHTIAIRWIALGLSAVVAIRYQSRLAAPRLPCIVPIALWLIVAASSLIWATRPGYSFAEFRIDVLYALAGFLILFALTHSEKVFYILLRSILVSSFTISIIAIVRFFQYGKWMDGYPNFLGEFSSCMLMAIAIIPLALLEQPHRRWKVRVVTITLVIVLAANLCAMSRMFWISASVMALVAGLMYAVGNSSANRTNVTVGLLLVATVGIAGFVVSSLRPERDLNTPDPRLAIWHQAVQNISEKPFTGAGFGREVYKERYEALMPGKGLYHAHNIFLSYGEQMGLQGTVILIVLFVALLVTFFRLWRTGDRVARNIGIAGTALVVGVVIKSTTDTHFGREVTLYFWAIIGMLLGLARRHTGASRERVVPENAGP